MEAGPLEKQGVASRSRLGKLISGLRALQPGSLMLFAYSLFLAGLFFVPNAVDVYKYYIIAVFFPGILFSIRAVGVINGSRVWLATLLCLAYMLSTSFWSRDFSLGELWYDARLTAYIVVFVLVTAAIGIRKNADLDMILKLVCVFAAVSALISIPYGYWQNAFPDSRLTSIGIFDGPNYSSYAYGFFCLLSGNYALQSARTADRILYALTALILLVFVLLTQSRTGILATLFSFLLLVAFSPRDKKAAFGIAMIIGVIFIFSQLAPPAVLSRLNEISFPNRIEIWRQALDLFIASPTFGQGYQSGFQASLPGSSQVYLSAHNAFIATLRDGGLAGLAFHLYMLVVAIRVGLVELVKNDNPIYLVLLGYYFICTLMATDQLITRPRELWIILWLPLALLVVSEVRNTRRTSGGQTRPPAADRF